MKSPGHSDHCRCHECCGTAPGSKPLISLCDVTFRRDERIVLSDVNLTVDVGDFIAITGPNGGGKTTLLRIILGLLKPSSVKVLYCNGQGELAPPPAIGYLPQKNSVDSHFPISVGEVVASGLLAEKNISKSERRERIAEVLAEVGLENFSERPIGKLSGGQLQRTLFARAIVRKPRILVLDEPLSYIDKHFENRLYEIMAELAKTTTILLVSHEMSEIGAMANRHIIVDRTLDECTAARHCIKRDC